MMMDTFDIMNPLCLFIFASVSGSVFLKIICFSSLKYGVNGLLSSNESRIHEKHDLSRVPIFGGMGHFLWKGLLVYTLQRPLTEWTSSEMLKLL